jgi:hypothetical protein
MWQKVCTGKKVKEIENMDKAVWKTITNHPKADYMKQGCTKSYCSLYTVDD